MNALLCMLLAACMLLHTVRGVSLQFCPTEQIGDVSNLHFASLRGSELLAFDFPSILLSGSELGEFGDDFAIVATDDAGCICSYVNDASVVVGVEGDAYFARPGQNDGDFHDLVGQAMSLDVQSGIAKLGDAAGVSLHLSKYTNDVNRRSDTDAVNYVPVQLTTTLSTSSDSARIRSSDAITSSSPEFFMVWRFPSRNLAHTCQGRSLGVQDQQPGVRLFRDFFHRGEMRELSEGVYPVRAVWSSLQIPLGYSVTLFEEDIADRFDPDTYQQHPHIHMLCDVKALKEFLIGEDRDPNLRNSTWNDNFRTVWVRRVGVPDGTIVFYDQPLFQGRSSVIIPFADPGNAIGESESLRPVAFKNGYDECMQLHPMFRINVMSRKLKDQSSPSPVILALAKIGSVRTLYTTAHTRALHCRMQAGEDEGPLLLQNASECNAEVKLTSFMRVPSEDLLAWADVATKMSQGKFDVTPGPSTIQKCMRMGEEREDPDASAHPNAPLIPPGHLRCSGTGWQVYLEGLPTFRLPSLRTLLTTAGAVQSPCLLLFSADASQMQGYTDSLLTFNEGIDAAIDAMISAGQVPMSANHTRRSHSQQPSSTQTAKPNTQKQQTSTTKSPPAASQWPLPTVMRNIPGTEGPPQDLCTLDATTFQSLTPAQRDSDDVLALCRRRPESIVVVQQPLSVYTADVPMGRQERTPGARDGDVVVRILDQFGCAWRGYEDVCADGTAFGPSNLEAASQKVYYLQVGVALSVPSVGASDATDNATHHYITRSISPSGLAFSSQVLRSEVVSQIRYNLAQQAVQYAIANSSKTMWTTRAPSHNRTAAIDAQLRAVGDAQTSFFWFGRQLHYIGGTVSGNKLSGSVPSFVAQTGIVRIHNVAIHAFIESLSQTAQTSEWRPGFQLTFRLVDLNVEHSIFLDSGDDASEDDSSEQGGPRAKPAPVSSAQLSVCLAHNVQDLAVLDTFPFPKVAARFVHDPRVTAADLMENSPEESLRSMRVQPQCRTTTHKYTIKSHLVATRRFDVGIHEHESVCMFSGKDFHGHRQCFSRSDVSVLGQGRKGGARMRDIDMCGEQSQFARIPLSKLATSLTVPTNMMMVGYMDPTCGCAVIDPSHRLYGSYYRPDGQPRTVKFYGGSYKDLSKVVFSAVKPDGTKVSYPVNKNMRCVTVHVNTGFYETLSESTQILEASALKQWSFAAKDPSTHSAHSAYFSNVLPLFSVSSKQHHELGATSNGLTFGVVLYGGIDFTGPQIGLTVGTHTIPFPVMRSLTGYANSFSQAQAKSTGHSICGSSSVCSLRVFSGYRIVFQGFLGADSYYAHISNGERGSGWRGSEFAVRHRFSDTRRQRARGPYWRDQADLYMDVSLPRSALRGRNYTQSMDARLLRSGVEQYDMARRRITLKKGPFHVPDARFIGLDMSAKITVSYDCSVVPCSNGGTCTGPNECSCAEGFTGKSCDSPLPDETSALMCTSEVTAGGGKSRTASDVVYAGDTLRCDLLPRFQGVGVSTYFQHFTLRWNYPGHFRLLWQWIGNEDSAKSNSQWISGEASNHFNASLSMETDADMSIRAPCSLDPVVSTAVRLFGPYKRERFSFRVRLLPVSGRAEQLDAVENAPLFSAFLGSEQDRYVLASGLSLHHTVHSVMHSAVSDLLPSFSRTAHWNQFRSRKLGCSTESPDIPDEADDLSDFFRAVRHDSFGLCAPWLSIVHGSTQFANLERFANLVDVLRRLRRFTMRDSANLFARLMTLKLMHASAHPAVNTMGDTCDMYTHTQDSTVLAMADKQWYTNDSSLQATPIFRNALSLVYSPDRSSRVVCNRNSSFIFQPVQCKIYPKSRGRAISTGFDAFSVSLAPHPGLLARISTLRACANTANQTALSQLQSRHTAGCFSFTYVVSRIPSKQGKARRWSKLRTGTNDKSANNKPKSVGKKKAKGEPDVFWGKVIAVKARTPKHDKAGAWIYRDVAVPSISVRFPAGRDLIGRAQVQMYSHSFGNAYSLLSAALRGRVSNANNINGTADSLVVHINLTASDHSKALGLRVQCAVILGKYAQAETDLTILVSRLQKRYSAAVSEAQLTLDLYASAKTSGDEGQIEALRVQFEAAEEAKTALFEKLGALQQKANVVGHLRSMHAQMLVAHASGDYLQAARFLDTLLSASYHCSLFRKLRAETSLYRDVYPLVKGDLSYLLHASNSYLVPAVAVINRTDSHSIVLRAPVVRDKWQYVFMLGQASYWLLGEANAAISNLKQCLRWSPEQRVCLRHLRRVQQYENMTKTYTDLMEQEDFEAAAAICADLLFTYEKHISEDQSLKRDYSRSQKAKRERQRRNETSSGANVRFAVPSEFVGLTRKPPYFARNRRDMCRLYFRLLPESAAQARQACQLALMIQSDLTSAEDGKQECEMHIFLAAALIELGLTDSARAELKYAQTLNSNHPLIDHFFDQLDEAVTEKSLENDYYKILNVSREATEKEIRKAYKKMSLMYHPDKNPDPDAAEMFLLIVEAYTVLSDPALRAQYDEGKTVNLQPDNFKPNFNVHPEDAANIPEDGKVRAWFMNEDGEKEWTEIHIKEAREDDEDDEAFDRHCCLMSADSLEESREEYVRGDKKE